MSLILLLLIVMAGYLFLRNQDLSYQIEKLRLRIEDLEKKFLGLAVRPEPVVKPTPPIPAIAKAPAPVTPRFQPTPAPKTPAATAWEPPKIDWENFMGVKLFAWLGGFALFLGMAFFVKYSIDHGWITPMMRVIAGFIIGVGSIVGGLALRGRKLDVTVQTLCAAGVAILYTDIFACRSFYNFISPEAAFPLMILVTVAAFLLAVRLDSRYVAILGMVGGFLTPVLLSTGVDRPFSLFSYLALLDVGVVAVALHKRWGFLVPMAAMATFGMEVGWTAKFFTPAKAETASGIYVLMALLFAGAAELGRRMHKEESVYDLSASGLTLATMGFVAYWLSFASLAARPGLTMTLLLALSAALAYWAFRRKETEIVYLVGGVFSFLLLFVWVQSTVQASLLFWALGYLMAFAIIHAILPFFLSPLTGRRLPGGYFAPLLALGIVVSLMITVDVLSFMLWPFVLGLGFLAFASAWVLASFSVALFSMALVLVSFGVWMFRLPDLSGLPGILMLMACFACASVAAALWAVQKLTQGKLSSASVPMEDRFNNAWVSLPAMAAWMPFALLGMIVFKMPMADPSAVFGVVLLLNVLLLALARTPGNESAAPTALVSTTVVEFFWLTRNAPLELPGHTLVWALVFYALFAIYPFLFHKSLKTRAVWITAAFAGLAQFPMVWDVVEKTLSRPWLAIVPAFFALPTLASLAGVMKIGRDERRTSQMAWFGGMALLFITAIIPIHFEKQWITLGFALEGAALVWLYRRVSHEGLKAWAIALLVTAFVRLALNPAVFSYHPRTELAIWNWYLFVYGVSAVAFYAASYWLTDRVKDGDFFGMPESKVPGILNAMGTILLFLLLNIEIADYFSTGSVITFNFSGNLAQDMTYSIAWALFATALLLVGIREGSIATRYASLGLLLITILKVFMHDLWRLGGLFRVGSIIGLAIILMLVSYLYQRYLSADKKQGVSRA